MKGPTARSFAHRLIVPDVPCPADYLPFLKEIHENRWYSNFGPLTRKLEDALVSTYGGVEECCVSCCNATVGLSAALLAGGRTGAVLIPAFTFPATLGAVKAAGLTPVVLDVDPRTWALDARRLAEVLDQTRAGAVILVAPFGIARSWDAEIAVCRDRGVTIVIDNASGLGGPRPASFHAENVFEVFSMHATKPFAVGEGGVVFAHRAHEAALRSVLSFALTSFAEPDGPDWGMNGKMSEFHAAVALAQLERYRDLVARRQSWVTTYIDDLARRPDVVVPADVRLAPWQFFPVLLPSSGLAEQFIDRASDRGVEIRRYYRPSLSRWPRTQSVGPCPVAEDLADRMCVLPVRACSHEADGSGLREKVLDVLHGVLDEN